MGREMGRNEKAGRNFCHSCFLHLKMYKVDEATSMLPKNGKLKTLPVSSFLLLEFDVYKRGDGFIYAS
jgi:hypothetical protein